MIVNTHRGFKVIFTLLLGLLGMDGFCHNADINFINKNIAHEESTSLVYCPFIQNMVIPSLDNSLLMPDTVCTSSTQDTFSINTTDKATGYQWNIPNGATLVEILGDTTIIVDWRTANAGLADLCVIATNSCGESTPTCLALFIDVCNQAPIAVPDTRTTPFNTPIVIAVQENDTDPNNDNITTFLDPTVPPSNGFVSLIDNTIRYIPNANFAGIDNFNYIICDDGFPALCDTANVLITIDHLAPIALNDSVTTPSKTPISIAVQENDSDPENGNLSTSLDPSNLPSDGSVMLDGSEIVYTPDPDFTGTDVFGYLVCDNGIPIKCDAAFVTVLVLNSPPIATDDSGKTPINTPILFTVQNNDNDPENGHLTTSLDATKPPSNGSVFTNGSTILYSPETNFTGTDEFDYIICDDGIPILCDTASVTIIIVNNAPIAADDTAITPSNNPITIDILDNDLDPDNGTIIVSLDPSKQVQNGTLDIVNNQVIYTPNQGFSGADCFNYIICDDGSPVQCDTARVDIIIENNAPIAVDDEVVTPSDTTIIIDVLDNDLDEEDGVLTISLDANKLAQNGMVAIVNDQVSYTPDAGFSGTDCFNYVICDDGIPSKCDTARVDIIIENNAPIAVDDEVLTTSNTTISIDVLTNDVDEEDGVLTISLDSSKLAQNAIVAIVFNQVVYTPDAGFSGTDCFNYIICDGGTPTQCDTARVDIIIANDAPIAVDDEASTPSDTSITIDVLDNDLDPDNGTIIVSLDNNKKAQNGTVDIVNNQAVYTPNQGFSGTDCFNYIICDDGSPVQCDTARVDIIIENDAPIAVDDGIITPTDTAIIIDVLGNDLDKEDGILTISLDTSKLAQSGLVAIVNNQVVYTPDAGFSGKDCLNYVVCDDGMPVKCDTAAVNIIIANDAPIAIDDEATTPSDTPIRIDVLDNDLDPDNGTLTISLDPTKQVQNGTLNIVNNQVSYTPNQGFSGTDCFNYIICDDGSPVQCDTARVDIIIDNNAPIAVDDEVITPSDTTIVIDVLDNDLDEEEGVLTVSLDSSKLAQNGLVTIVNDQISYTPDAGFSGTDCFNYVVCDDGMPAKCDTARVDIIIANDAPIAVDDEASTPSDTTITIDVLDNDLDPDNGIISVSLDPSKQAQNGTIDIVNNQAVYTPNQGFSGTDCFNYIICDDGSPVQCDTARVDIIIENDAPIAVDDEVVTPSDTTIVIDVLDNDLDEEDGVLTISLDSSKLAQNGIVAIVNNQVSYTPDAGFSGTDCFNYVICDDGMPAKCDTATVTIIIANNEPIAIDDRDTTALNTPLIIDILANDFDPENGILSTLIDNNNLPTNGVVVKIDDQMEYTPNRGFIGTDSFDYILCDDGIPRHCDTATVFVYIPNPAPIAINDINTTLINTPVEGNILINDSDPLGDKIEATTTAVQQPLHGSVMISPDGNYIYTPVVDYVGEDFFFYEICDNYIPKACDTAKVSITILVPDTNTDANNPPIGIADHFQTIIDRPVASTLISNDSEPDGDNILINTRPIQTTINGDLSIFPNGTFVYTPASGFIGVDEFSYQICDDQEPALCDTVEASITILDNPTELNTTFATDDAGILDKNTTYSSNLLLNDHDPEGDLQNLQMQLVQQPKQGLVSLATNGRMTYTPNEDYTGPDQLQYAIMDTGNPIAHDTATVYLIILPNNVAPIAINDTSSTIENVPVSGNVLINDIEPDGDGLIVSTTVIANPINGTTIIEEGGDYTYTPNPNFIGTDQFTYVVCEDTEEMLCDTANVLIIIVPNDTICKQVIPAAILMANEEVCPGDSIVISTQENYPPASIANSDSSRFEFIWLNGRGDTISISTTPNLIIAASDSLAISPFSMQTKLGVCYADMSNALSVSISELPDLDLSTTNDSVSICNQESVQLFADFIPNANYQWRVLNDSIIISTEQNPIFNELDSTSTFELTVRHSNCEALEKVALFTVTVREAIIVNPQILSSDSLLCENSSLQLGIDIGDTIPLSVQWTGPDGFSSTEQNPLITNVNADNNGIYTVSIISQDNCSSETNSLIVNNIQEAIPTPTIIGNVLVCSDENIQLSIVENYEAGSTYEWTNGMGTIISTANTLTIAATDTLAITPYQVQVKINDCSSQLSTAYEVGTEQTGVALITSSKTGICPGESVELSARTIENASYEWRQLGESRLISTAQSTILTNIQTTTAYELTINSTTCVNTTTKDTIIISISTPIELQPQSSLSLKEDCSPPNLLLNANFNVSTDDDLVIQWTGPNNFVSNEALVVIEEVTTDFNGIYTIVVTNPNGCSNSATVFVNDIQESVTVPTISSVEGAVCENANIRLFAPSYEGVIAQYTWYDNDVVIPNSNTRELFVDDALLNHSYTVEVNFNNCQLLSDAFTPIVFEKPSLSIDETNTVLCTDGEENLTLSTNITGGQLPHIIEWVGPNNFSSTNPNPTLINVSTEDAGTYTIRVSDQNNCLVEASTEVDIMQDIPKPTIESTGNACAGETIVLSAPAYTQEVTYEWILPESVGINPLTTQTINIPSGSARYTGDYIVKVKVNECEAQSEIFQLAVLEQPIASPTAIYNSPNCALANLTLFANAIGDNLSYEWKGPNGFTSTIADPIIVNASPENNGLYELTVSNQVGCTVTAVTDLVDNIQPTFSEPIIQTSGFICEGGFITLSAPIYNGTSVSYNWLLNETKIDNENSPELVIGPLTTNNAFYQLEVIVDDCILLSDPYFPDVFENPIVTPTYELSSPCGDGNLQLSATIIGDAGNRRYRWTGPDGFSSESLSPFISNVGLENNGTYSLTIISETGCEATSNIVINDILSGNERPQILANNSSCINELVHLQVDNPVPDANYIWLNATGDTISRSSELRIESTAPLAISPYTVSIEGGNCGILTSLPFDIALVEIPNVQVGNTGPVCTGQSVQLFVTELAGASYAWYDNTGALIATEAKPTITNITTTSIYEVAITVAGCTNTQRKETEVVLEAIPQITNITKTATFCEGETIQLFAENANAVGQDIQYIWTGPNGFSFTETTSTDSFELSLPSITTNQAGSYSLTLNSARGCSSDTRSVLINVQAGLVAPTLSVEENAVCAGSRLALTANSVVTTPIQYEWYIQDTEDNLQLINTTNTPNLIIDKTTSDDSGDYLVRVINENCASNYSNLEKITVFGVNTDIEVFSNVGIDRPACSGETIELSVPFYSDASYRWFGPAGFEASSHNPIIENSSSIHEGDYFAIIEMSGCPEITSIPAYIAIGTKPATPSIVSNGPICMGADLSFEVNSILPDANDISYDWFNSEEVLIASTDVPRRDFTNVPAAFSDSYYVIITADGCESERSDLMEVLISSPSELTANAGEDQQLCAAAIVDLTANEPNIGTGKWQAIGQATISNDTAAITQSSNLQQGVNQFVWTITDDICGGTASDTVQISVGKLTNDQAFVGPDQDLCEQTSALLVANPLTESFGQWTQSAAQSAQGVFIEDPLNPSTTIEGLTFGNSYTFTWTISQTDCPDFEQDELVINVSDIPVESALIQEETLFLCEENQVRLNAEIPTLSTGLWTQIFPSTDSSSTPEIMPTIATPSNPSTFVEGLASGENIFIWSLSNGACRNFSTDTLRIHSSGSLIANADDYLLNFNDSLVLDILANDQVSAASDFDLIITKFPDFGSLEQHADGTVTYQPDSNYFGVDNFRYKLCSPGCESLCDTAIVNLGVTGVEGSGACFIPNVISPNQDNNNDIFLVACIDDFPDNQLSIFNRWGDKVFGAAPYNNDWEGNYEGQPLPAGTYFYVLQLEENGAPIQGFITLFR